MKINCPLCNKELINLNDIIIDGVNYKYHFEFWCDNCNIDLDLYTDKEF